MSVSSSGSLFGAAAFQGETSKAGEGQEQVTLIKCFIAAAGVVHALSSPVGPNQCNQNNTAYVLELFLAHICVLSCPSRPQPPPTRNPVVTQCWPAACHWRRPQDDQTVAPDKTSISLSRSYVQAARPRRVPAQCQIAAKRPSRTKTTSIKQLQQGKYPDH